MNFLEIPKVELHLHLDCSLSFDVIKKLDPSVTVEEYRRKFIAPDKCLNLADYLTRAYRAVELMQTTDHLELVTLDLYRQLYEDGVIYAEIRFAPLQHLEQGLTPDEVVRTVLDASEKGKKMYGIEGGIILCTLRHFNEIQSMNTAELAVKFHGKGVVGFDIAADEAGFSISEHISAFQYVSEYGIPSTAHAGEAKGAESVRETIKYLKPARIGHGVRSAEDKDLLNRIIGQNIHLEICPTSNVQTNVYADIRDHTIDQLYRSGVSLSINTDSKTVSNVTLSGEYQLLANEFGWTPNHFKQCLLNAIDHAFTTDEFKNTLRKRILSWFETAIPLEN